MIFLEKQNLSGTGGFDVAVLTQESKPEQNKRDRSKKMKKTIFAMSILLSVLVYVASFAHAESESLADLKFTCFAQSRFDAEIGENAEGETELLADKFRVTRVRIRATGKLVKTVGFFVQMDAASNPALKDARLRVGCPSLPITLEMGRFLLPFGIETPINPYWLPAVDYSLTTTSMMTGWWDVGAKVYGKKPVSKQLTLNYVVAVVNGNTGGFKDNNKSKDFLGRLGVSLPMGLSLGGSFYIGKKPGMADGEMTGDDVTKNRFGGDVKLSSGPLLVQAEGILGKNDDIDALAFYVLGAFKIHPCTQLVAKFDFLDPNTDSDVENDDVNRIRVGANFFIAGNNQLQVFYQLRNNAGENGTTSHDIITQLAVTFDAP